MTKYRNDIAPMEERRRERMNAAGESEVMTIVRRSLKGCCAGCVVPVGVFKAMQVAAGLRFPRTFASRERGNRRNGRGREVTAANFDLNLC